MVNAVVQPSERLKGAASPLAMLEYKADSEQITASKLSAVRCIAGTCASDLGVALEEAYIKLGPVSQDRPLQSLEGFDMYDYILKCRPSSQSAFCTHGTRQSIAYSENIFAVAPYRFLAITQLPRVPPLANQDAFITKTRHHSFDMSLAHS